MDKGISVGRDSLGVHESRGNIRSDSAVRPAVLRVRLTQIREAFSASRFDAPGFLGAIVSGKMALVIRSGNPGHPKR